jgi:hypothetical protein
MTDFSSKAHLHLIDSFAYGWRKRNLIHEQVMISIAFGDCGFVVGVVTSPRPSPWKGEGGRVWVNLRVWEAPHIPSPFQGEG